MTNNIDQTKVEVAKLSKQVAALNLQVGALNNQLSYVAAYFLHSVKDEPSKGVIDVINTAAVLRRFPKTLTSSSYITKLFILHRPAQKPHE
jgi:hypothetical protein